MKLKYLLILSLFSFKISVGQVTNSFPDMGNVGIGITTPVEKLDVVGNILLRNYVNGVSAGPSISFSSFADFPGPKIRSYLDYASGANSSSRLILSSYSSGYNDELTLIGGNVGIGTITPQGKLDIFNSTNISSIPLLCIRSNFHVPGNYGMIRFGDYTQNTNFQKGAIIYESMSASTKGRFHIALESTDGAASVSIADAKLTVLPDGNVGIGTINPSDKLSVSGKIRAKEIKVEVANWPDYVFAKEYNLPSLQEAEKHIKDKGHLLGIPPAIEVTSNGVDLGEMNGKLLKKIEELTLYLIEQNKANQSQDKKIEVLQQQIDKLKSSI